MRMWSVYAVIMLPAAYCGYRFWMEVWLNRGKLHNIPFRKLLWFHGAFGGVYLVFGFVHPWIFNVMVCLMGAGVLFVRKQIKLNAIELGALQLQEDALTEEQEELKRQIEEQRRQLGEEP